ncbi:hypothetical protein [Spirosoma radiotolerans]|uniref:hypothetical protein n=1 Tax=Spirosoma radiotolerans TaxID=1379870 RepID=UPI000698403D|nr:hypothetical protein [Spirosoma radiotolerans]
METESITLQEQAPKTVMAGSNLPEQIQDAKPAGHPTAPLDTVANLSPATFSTFFTWRGNGLVNVRALDARITANSRVFVSISEFNSDARQNRFIGNASMSVLNVSPFNGGFWARINVNFSQALNVRLDVLVDPSGI